MPARRALRCTRRGWLLAPIYEIKECFSTLSARSGRRNAQREALEVLPNLAHRFPIGGKHKFSDETCAFASEVVIAVDRHQ